MTTIAPDLELFATAVVSRLGFNVDKHNAEQVDDVLRRRLERTGCKTVDSYVGRFDDPEFAQQELREVALALTVPETYFFRHTEQFQALAEAVLPACLKARGSARQLNVLSAACASGEEAYSVAATILKAPGFQGWDVRIRGVDVNAHLLRKAREGRYSEWSLRATSEPERRRYFRREGGEFVLDDKVKAMVRFEERNLLEGDASFWQAGLFDIIFCRNVMIYFTPTAMRTLIARLTRVLTPGGFLFLGPSETLRGISHDFHLRHTHGAFYYQHRLPGEPPSQAAAIMAPSQPTAASPPAHPPDGLNWASAIADASHRIAALADPSRAKSPQPAAGPVFPAKQDMDEVRDLLRQERFEDALRAIDALPGDAAADPDALMIQAVLLANRGELDRAEQLCAHLLATDELRPGAHYLMAVCREKRGDHLSAAEHDQTAIYLDGAFAMPRLHLGLLARRLGDLATARRELGEALALLAREDASRILLFGGGFSREALTRFCQAQLERCGGNP
ncbi:MAG: hypothetical protein HZC54_03855 [Verrucomicrobia bacterium]|nr:hypothetical protein [Verrucomicrobiota bacterium]